jgi:hypothetical protein
MTYSHAISLRGLGATGDRFAVGQEITARFTPHGVGAANQAATFAALSAAMARAGVMNAPTYLGWGSADNAGLVVFKGKTKTDAFTAAQVANKMPAVVADVTRATGAARLSFVSIRAPVPTGPAVEAAAPAAATPGDASPGVAPDPGAAYAPATQPGAAVEEAGFFSRKVAGIPVWGIGVGVLALGAGLVTVAMVMNKKKKATPAALAANRRRARLRRNGRADYRPRFSEDFGDEGDIGAHSAAASAVARAEGERARSLSQTGSALEAELRAEKLSKDAKFLDRLRRLRRNPPLVFDAETRALAQQVYGRK